MARKLKELISIEEALDNLGVINEMDLTANNPLVVVKDYMLVVQKEKGFGDLEWLSVDNVEEVMTAVCLTLETLLSYLEELYINKETDWDSIETKKGIETIMTQAGEAINKLDSYFSLFPKLPKKIVPTKTKEYKALQNFFLNKLSVKCKNAIDGEKAWSDQWEGNEESLNLDLEHTGLKDFETVKQDTDYELFSINDAKNEPFFNQALISNIEMYCDFDETAKKEAEEDPLLKTPFLLDRSMQRTAEQILHMSEPCIRKFYKLKISPAKSALAGYLHTALMALFMASNEKNLLQNTLQPKSCLQYFEDFQSFLREALANREYQKLTTRELNKKDKENIVMLHLCQTICHSLYFHKSGIKEEMIGHIYRLVRMGEEERKRQKQKIVSLPKSYVLEKFIEKNENLSELLKVFPNGPLFLNLDVIREKEKKSFDPILQKNIPSLLYDINIENKNISILRVPSPTFQTTISKAQIIPEFTSFLLSLTKEKVIKKHLLIQLQNKNSFKESARAESIEKLSSISMYRYSLSVISLPKNSDFYYQRKEYLDINDAEKFKEIIQKELFEKKDSGFYFPKKNEI